MLRYQQNLSGATVEAEATSKNYWREKERERDRKRESASLGNMKEGGSQAGRKGGIV
jgi:hypothetical protein